MKKVFRILMVALLFGGILVGCGTTENHLPHNKNIELSATKKEIIEKDNLEELTKDNPSYDYLTQISATYQNAEKELGKQYIKEKDSKVNIEGYEFRVSYILNDEDGLRRTRYRGSNIDEDGQQELLEYLIGIYGEEIKNAEFAMYNEYHEIKVEKENQIYNVTMGIPEAYPDEVWIEIYLLKK